MFWKLIFGYLAVVGCSIRAMPTTSGTTTATAQTGSSRAGMQEEGSVASRLLEALSPSLRLAIAGDTSTSMETITALVLYGNDYAEEPPVMRQQLRTAHTQGIPILLAQVSFEQKQSIFEDLNIPIRHLAGGSEVLLVDTFHIGKDEHYRLIHLPDGRPAVPDSVESADGQLVFKQQRASSATLVAVADTEHVNQTQIDGFRKDAQALLDVAADSSTFTEIASELNQYLLECGGVRSEHALKEQCWNHIQVTAPSANGMVPEQGAVWRELIETSFRVWQVVWGNPFPFKSAQEVSHRLNTYWYMYVQAPPFSQLYYAFVLVDGIHNPKMQLSDPAAVGLYLSNLEIDLHAESAKGEESSESIFWLKSSPSTQNTKHEIGRSFSSTDSYSLNLNLGFEGKKVKGGFGFNYTKSFTASYSEQREITDWSIVEDTDPQLSIGSWKYYQTWPVDMLENNVRNFGRNWPAYYEQPWNPCRVNGIPNLSRFALTTHDSMVWAVHPSLRSEDGKNLPLRFHLNVKPTMSAHTCEVYDGHHKIMQSTHLFDDMGWEVNVAALNNIQWEE